MMLSNPCRIFQCPLAIGRLVTLSAVLVVTLTWGASGQEAATPRLRLDLDDKRPLASWLSWDTETGSRADTNLLRSDSALGLRASIDGKWKAGSDFPIQVDRSARSGKQYTLSIASAATLSWQLLPDSDRLAMTFTVAGPVRESLEAVEVVFPFNPRVTATTVLPSQRHEDATFELPAIINAPDFGQMLIAESQGRHLKARLEGDRNRKTRQVNLYVRLPELAADKPCTLTMTPIWLDPPTGLQDESLWRLARRGWFGTFQPTAAWGDPLAGRQYGAPAGVLANNVISDPASCALWFYADQALWTPELAPGVSIANVVRDTTEWWLDERRLPSGEMICYWDKTGFLDACAGPLIAAWDYVEATGDDKWLATRIEQLEQVADFLAKRDVDCDGLVEARRSGNRGTLLQPQRSCCWWDAVNYGHKCGYSNAVIYRAWRCLADLEQRLCRTEQAGRYTRLANRLKEAYARTLYNPQTGWLAGWKSADGELHDYGFTTVNALAIEYGLVEPDQGRQILQRLWQKMADAGFEKIELGIPSSLIPIRREDYLITTLAGGPNQEDGSDTFGQYMNGGISAGFTLHFLAAHYVVGQQEQADQVLRAMLDRQQSGTFQNGVVNSYPGGIDWTDWQGKSVGYEGYLADSFRFLQAVLLREPAFRDRLYRPLRVR
jgi:hypothetical protein